MKLINKLVLGSCMLAPLAAYAQTPAQPAKTQKAGALAAPVKVTSVEGLTEYRLGNGLRVLLAPDASKPTLTTNIVYKVGSRNENYGETGMAHLLEHLLFKPSANFGVKKGTQTPVQVLNAIGGTFNGSTWFDRTNYFAIFPANDDNLHLMLSLEADRMVNAAIDQNDLWNPKTSKGEMTVVRNEYEMGESDPENVTTQRMQSVAYDWHNYGKSTIGARSDIELVNIAHLKAFYKNYYQPDNAMLMVAGRFDEAKVLKQINEMFGVIPRPTRVIAPTYTVEPVQDGERAVTVRRSGGTQFVAAGYHFPATSHPDDAALAILGHIMSDSAGGRLHKALVEAKLATQVSEQTVSTLEPGFGIFEATVPKDGKLDAAQEVLLQVLEGVKAQPITEAEVTSAKQSLSKESDLDANDTAKLTIQLTEAMAAGDWRLYFLRRDRIEKVTVADVQAAAEKYLKPTNRTLGRFIPTDTIDRTEIPAKLDVAAMVQDYKGRAVMAQGEVFDASPANIDARTQRFTLPGGLQGALLPKKTKGASVSVALHLRLGTEASLMGKRPVASYTAAMLMRGSEHHTRQEIKETFDKLKATVALQRAEDGGVMVKIDTVRENLPATLDLVAEVLEKPSFPSTEFQQLQREIVASAEQQIPDPSAQALNALRRTIDGTPEGHVRHVSTLPENLVLARGVTEQDVKAFHAGYYGASGATVSAVGDFDAVALKAQLDKLFGSWKASQPFARIPEVVKTTKASSVQIETPDKENSALFAVTSLAINDSDADYPAMVMVDQILGGGALHSRLADRIRQKEGLSYGVGSWIQAPAIEPAGAWTAYAISAPQNTLKVEAALREELQRAIADGFTAAELDEGKKAWLQSQNVNLAVDSQLADQLSGYLTVNRTMAYDKNLQAKVAALTVAQVNDVLRKRIKMENISIVMAGDFAKVKADEAAAKK